MPPPSPLTIATSSLSRLLKEETSYHAELGQQERSIARLENLPAEERDENHGFAVRQEVCIVF